MNYNKIIKYCDKYFINRYSYNGKPLTYNKLKHLINEHTNKKNKLSKKQKMYNSVYNSIVKYFEYKISENELDNAIYHYMIN